MRAKMRAYGAQLVVMKPAGGAGGAGAGGAGMPHLSAAAAALEAEARRVDPPVRPHIPVALPHAVLQELVRPGNVREKGM